MTSETSVQTPLKFTEAALIEIKRLKTLEDETKFLRVGVKGGGCSGMTYVLEFDSKQENDKLYSIDDFTFIMNPAHEIYLLDMEIDFGSGLNARGFTFHNPNASSTCGCGTSFAV
ncbi:MAG: iron-sulfur cluster assembly accessory protein [Chitinophagaceae bacterium]